MTLDFREVLPKAISVAKQHMHPNWELTILRDVTGRVRVVIDGSLESEKLLCNALLADLQAALGDWLGLLSPVWVVDKTKKSKPNKQKPSATQKTSVDLILEELRSRRRPVEPGLWVVERHVSHEAWTGSFPVDLPWEAPHLTQGKEPPIITFFSHKGGVGRTTALVAAAANLTRKGKNVLVVDLDLEAPGLDSLMQDWVVPDLGVIDLLMLPTPLDQQSVERACVKADGALSGDGALWVLQAGKVDDAYMEALARLDARVECDHKNLLERLRGLFCAVWKKFDTLDYILVDSRAGFHDLGGLMLASLTHCAVMVVTASPQSEHGLRRVAKLLGARGLGANAVPLVLAHGMAPERGKAQLESERKLVCASAYRLLCEAGYYGGNPPAEEAEGFAHDVVSLHWSDALRGRGGKLDTPMLDLLCDKPYTTLTDRLVSRIL